MSDLQCTEWKQKSHRGIFKKRINRIKSACLGSGLFCECLFVVESDDLNAGQIPNDSTLTPMTLDITWTLSSVDLICSCLDLLVWFFLRA